MCVFSCVCLFWENLRKFWVSGLDLIGHKLGIDLEFIVLFLQANFERVLFVFVFQLISKNYAFRNTVSHQGEVLSCWNIFQEKCKTPVGR